MTTGGSAGSADLTAGIGRDRPRRHLAVSGASRKGHRPRRGPVPSVPGSRHGLNPEWLRNEPLGEVRRGLAEVPPVPGRGPRWARGWPRPRGPGPPRVGAGQAPGGGGRDPLARGPRPDLTGS